MEATKEAIRRAMRRRRRALSPAELRAAERAVARRVAALPVYRDVSTVLAYWPIDGEVPTGALLEQAFAGGRRVFLPRVRRQRMTFAEHRPGAPLRPGAYAIPEPAGDSFEPRAGEPFVVLAPLVAWDVAGTRLGRGKGHYDRALAALPPGGVLVGLGYDFQQHPALPRDPWDVTLDWVVTEGATVRCRRGEPALPTRKEETTQHGIHGNGPGQPRAGRGSRLGTGSPPAPAG